MLEKHLLKQISVHLRKGLLLGGPGGLHGCGLWLLWPWQVAGAALE